MLGKNTLIIIGNLKEPAVHRLGEVLASLSTFSFKVT